MDIAAIVKPFGVAVLDDAYRDGIIEVLTLAFKDAPGTRHLGEDDARRLREVRVLWEEGYRWQRAMGEPILGVLRENRVLAAAVINLPDAKASILGQYRWMLGLTLRLGLAKTRHVLKTNKLIDEHTPDRPQCFLHILGSHPDVRGTGCGGALLHATHALSEAHPGSEGVALETENPNNVPLYEHFGYEVQQEFDCAGIPGWTMFRPNAGVSG